MGCKISIHIPAQDEPHKKVADSSKHMRSKSVQVEPLDYNTVGVRVSLSRRSNSIQNVGNEDFKRVKEKKLKKNKHTKIRVNRHYRSDLNINQKVDTYSDKYSSQFEFDPSSINIPHEHAAKEIEDLNRIPIKSLESSIEGLRVSNENLSEENHHINEILVETLKRNKGKLKRALTISGALNTNPVLLNRTIKSPRTAVNVQRRNKKMKSSNLEKDCSEKSNKEFPSSPLGSEKGNDLIPIPKAHDFSFVMNPQVLKPKNKNNLQSKLKNLFANPQGSIAIDPRKSLKELMIAKKLPIPKEIAPVISRKSDLARKVSLEVKESQLYSKTQKCSSRISSSIVIINSNRKNYGKSTRVAGGHIRNSSCKFMTLSPLEMTTRKSLFSHKGFAELSSRSQRRNSKEKKCDFFQGDFSTPKNDIFPPPIEKSKLNVFSMSHISNKKTGEEDCQTSKISVTPSVIKSVSEMGLQCINNYQLSQCLGRGSFSDVYKAKDMNNGAQFVA